MSFAAGGVVSGQPRTPAMLPLRLSEYLDPDESLGSDARVSPAAALPSPAVVAPAAPPSAGVAGALDWETFAGPFCGSPEAHVRATRPLFFKYLAAVADEVGADSAPGTVSASALIV